VERWGKLKLELVQLENVKSEEKISLHGNDGTAASLATKFEKKNPNLLIQ